MHNNHRLVKVRYLEESIIQSGAIQMVTVPVLLQWTDQVPSVEPSLQPEQSLQESAHGWPQLPNLQSTQCSGLEQNFKFFIDEDE